MFLIIVPLIALLLGNAAAQTYEECTTFSGVQGLCRPVRTCSDFMRVLNLSNRSGSNKIEARTYLQQNICIFNQPWVCCPRSVPRTTTPITPLAPKRNGLLPVAPACGVESTDKIVGGDITRIDEFPWLVQLVTSLRGDPTLLNYTACAGSLISRQYVLTAAHCIPQRIGIFELSHVRLGDWDTSTNPDTESYNNEDFQNDPFIDVAIDEIIVHENYNATSIRNDIALLRLSEPVALTRFIRPICLPLDDGIRNLDLTGRSLDVAGWGATEDSPRSEKKLKVDLPGLSNDQCQRILGNEYPIVDTQICAGGQRMRDACFGDSGGPLMRFHLGGTPHYYLAGVVSYGFPVGQDCGTESLPSIYTRTSEFIDWIESNVRE